MGTKNKDTKKKETKKKASSELPEVGQIVSFVPTESDKKGFTWQMQEHTEWDAVVTSVAPNGSCSLELVSNKNYNYSGVMHRDDDSRNENDAYWE